MSAKTRDVQIDRSGVSQSFLNIVKGLDIVGADAGDLRIQLSQDDIAIGDLTTGVPAVAIADKAITFTSAASTTTKFDTTPATEGGDRVLLKNIMVAEPTTDYEPTTKKYVDDEILNNTLNSGSGITIDGSSNIDLGGTLDADAEVITDGYGVTFGNRTGVVGQESFLTGGRDDYGLSANTASGRNSVVMGAYGSTASGNESIIIGGRTNTSTAILTAVIGGQSNDATASRASVIGGSGGTADGLNAFVAGGTSGTATGTSSAVIGGATNNAQATNSAILGGNNNTAYTSGSTILGGNGNQVGGTNSTIVGGSANTSVITSTRMALLGGYVNQADGTDNVVVGSRSSIVRGTQNGILAGIDGDITTDAINSAIIAGDNNQIGSSRRSAIIGGYNNVVGGSPTTEGVILASNGSTINANGAYSVIAGGISINTDDQRTLFADNIRINTLRQQAVDAATNTNITSYGEKTFLTDTSLGAITLTLQDSSGFPDGSLITVITDSNASTNNVTIATQLANSEIDGSTLDFVISSDNSVYQFYYDANGGVAGTGNFILLTTTDTLSSVTGGSGIEVTGSTIDWNGALTQDAVITGATGTYDVTLGSSGDVLGVLEANATSMTLAAGASGLTVTSASTASMTANGGDMTLEATSGAVLIDSSANLSLDGAGATGSNFTHDSGNLTLSTTTSGNANITSADALNLTAGSTFDLTLNGASTITDSRGTPLGLEYAADYSATFADRSLVDKAYVDSVAAGLDPKASVRLATDTALADTPTYNNGTAGVGATLTGTGNTTLTVDGVAPVAGDRVLVKNQAAALENGIYDVTNNDGVTSWILTRSSDFDGSPDIEVDGGEHTFVGEGTVNADTGWVVTTDYTVVGDADGICDIGTEVIEFTQFSSAGVITASNGLTKTGNNITLGGTLTGATAINGAQDLTIGNSNALNTFTVDTSGAISLDATGASNMTVDSADLTLSTTTSGDVIVSSAGNLTGDADSISLDATGASNYSVTGANLTVSTETSGILILSGATEATIESPLVDINATGAVTIDSAAASNFTVNSADLTLSTITSGNLIASSAGNVDIDGADITLDATAAISLDSAAASNFTVDSADLTLSTTTSGNLIASSAGNVDIDGNDITLDATAGISLDSAAASNVTVDSANLTLSTTTSGDVIANSAEGLLLTAGDQFNLTISSTVPSGTSPANGDAIITDSRATPRGLQYDSDYAASFTDRSLIDKAYVDDAITAADLNSGSGITIDGGTNEIDLGGNLTQDANVVTAGYGVTFGNRNGGTVGAESVVLGGVAAGNGNNAETTSSAVVGGQSNDVYAASYPYTSTGDNAVIIGGYANVTRGQGAGIVASNATTANGNYTFIGGTNSSTIDYNVTYSAIIGAGSGSTINGTTQYSAVIGGQGTASANNAVAIATGGVVAATYSVIAGGQGEISSGYSNSFIGGGAGGSTLVQGSGSAVIGGYNNSVEIGYAAIVAGNGGIVQGNQSVIIGGQNGNIDATSDNSAIAGGYNNDADSPRAFIGGGSSNNVGFSSNNSAIVAGSSNSVTLTESFIGGGSNNSMLGTTYNNSAILGGNTNQVLKSNSAVIAGSSNIVDAASSVIIAGDGNTINATHSNSVILGGTSITSDDIDTVYSNANRTRTYRTESVTIGGAVTPVSIDASGVKVVKVDTSTQAITVNLDDANFADNLYFTIISDSNTSTNNITVSSNSSANIDGSASNFVINEDNAVYQFFWDGTEHFLISTQGTTAFALTDGNATTASGTAVDLGGTMTAAVNIDGSGSNFAMTLGSTNDLGGLTVNTSTHDVNATGAITLDAQGASNFSVADAALTLETTGTSAGDLTIQTTGNNADIIITPNGTGTTTVNSDFFVNGAKFFDIEHPNEQKASEGWRLKHTAIEGDEVAVYYRGEAETDVNGKAVVELPSYFEDLCHEEGRTVQITPLITFDDEIVMPMAAGRIKDGKFLARVISGSKAQKFYWEVKAKRSDRPVQFEAEYKK